MDDEQYKRMEELAKDFEKNLGPQDCNGTWSSNPGGPPIM